MLTIIITLVLISLGLQHLAFYEYINGGSVARIILLGILSGMVMTAAIHSTIVNYAIKPYTDDPVKDTLIFFEVFVVCAFQYVAQILFMTSKEPFASKYMMLALAILVEIGSMGMMFQALNMCIQ